ncbi:hypothetical protein V5O48_007520 [Marasmius crinis-equi]|uniref:Uncharacterized protein n=1 Tax=Marasmius crinis-equi TaxID=585013 RepID=A0ABR3FGI8_9AGAR
MFDEIGGQQDWQNRVPGLQNHATGDQTPQFGTGLWDLEGHRVSSIWDSSNAGSTSSTNLYGVAPSDEAAQALLQLHNQPQAAPSESYMINYPIEDKPGSKTVRLNPYGHVDILKIPPRQPNMADFLHPSASLSSLVPDTIPSTLEPPPISAPPPTVNHVYPQSPVWYRTSDPGYALGTCYSTNVSADNIREERARQLSVAVPYGIDVEWNGRDFTYRNEVGGCVTPPPSVPLRIDIHQGNRWSGSATFACYHTPESLADLHPSVWAQVQPLFKALETEVFGRFADPNGLPDVRPFFSHENLKQNDRSSSAGQRTNVASGETQTYDGSYSLTITVEQGHENGTVKPISQLGTDSFRNQLHTIVSILKQLYKLLVPLSVSEFEWEMISFQLKDNNVFLMGGLDVSGVAVQMNVSSSALHRVLAGSLTRGLELAHSIGRPQGNLHPDPMDAVTVKTLLTVLFRLPKGSAAGSMLLARYGIQVPLGKSTGEVWVVNIVFDARTIHGARNVSIIEDDDFELFLPADLGENERSSDWHALKALWNKASKVNRVAFVQYVPHQAAFRTGNYACTPSVHFGNTGSLGDGDAMVKTLAGDGEHILGTSDESKSFLGTDASFALFNMLANSGIELDSEINASYLISKMSYVYRDKETGRSERRKLIAPSQDVLNPRDRDHIVRMRQYLAWYYQLLQSILLNITQPQFFEHQDQLLLPPPPPINPDYMSKSHSDIRQTALLPTAHGRLSQRQKQKQAEDIVPSSSSLKSKPRTASRTTTTAKSSTKSRKKRSTGCGQAKNTTKTVSKGAAMKMSGRTGEKRRRCDSEGESEIDVEERSPKKTCVRDVSDEEKETQELTVGLQGEFFVVGATVFGDYSLDKIVEHEYSDGTYWYRVSFEGWPLEKALWYKEIDLPDALSMVHEYKMQHKLGQTSPYTALDGSILQDVFGAETLQARYKYVVDARSIFTASRKSFAMDSNFKQFAAAYREQATRQHYLTASLSELPLPPVVDDNYPLSSSGASANHLFERVVEAIKPVPLLVETAFALDIWKQAVLWQQCRSIMILYHFLTWGLPDLANILVQTYSRDPKFLEDNYPRYYPLIHHLWGAVDKYRAQYRSHSRGKRVQQRRRMTNVHDNEGGDEEERNGNSRLVGAVDGVDVDGEDRLVVDVPGNLFGLHPSATEHAGQLTYCFRNKRVDPNNEGVAKHVREGFIDLVERHVIGPPLEGVVSPKAFGKRKAEQSSNAVQLLIDELVVRGALLTTVAEALGDESIFASPTVELLIQRPLTSLWDGRTYSRIADRLRKNRDHEVDHLRAWIANNVTSATLDLITDLGYQTHLVISEFVEGRKLSDRSYAGVNRRLVKEQVSGARKLKDDRRLLTVEELVGNRENISFGVVALILREVMLEDTGGHHQGLHWYLKGLDPSSGQPGAGFDQDCSYPIRHRNPATQLLQNHIPADRLTTELGLSNLFSWMGTGQGNRTSTFLSFLEDRRDKTFWSDGFEECQNQFIAAFHHNQSILIGHRNVSVPEDREAPPPNIPGLLQYSNCRIYGQAANLLKLMPTASNQRDFLNTFPPKSGPEERIRRKFAPYWEPRIQEKWRAFLGDMLDVDPGEFDQAQKHSWWDALDFIQSLGIDGFRDGLTAMQATNNLALAGVVLMPTIDEMASWIWLHQDKGAFRGLQQLGFASMPTRRAVVVALQCFCDHLWNNCPPNLCEALGCERGNVIDAEHLLCKVSRWTSKIKELQAQARDAEISSDFLTDTTFPFPLRAPIEVVQVILDRIQYLCSTQTGELEASRLNPSSHYVICLSVQPTATMLALDALTRLQTVLASNKPLSEKLSLSGLERFIRLAREMSFNGAAASIPKSPPSELPSTARHLLSLALNLTENEIQQIWAAALHVVWDGSQLSGNPTDDDCFRSYGSIAKHGAYLFRPPYEACITLGCQDHCLASNPPIECRAFTLRRGMLPAFYEARYCASESYWWYLQYKWNSNNLECNTGYYPNYFITNAGLTGSKRVYYENKVPEFLHVQMHTFVESALVRLFEAQMLFQHSSAQNITRVYNMVLGKGAVELPQSGNLLDAIREEVVYDAFYLHSLVRDCEWRGTGPLVLRHDVTQAERIDLALADRNRLMVGNGQEMWAHACDKCMKIVEQNGQKEYLTAVVTDGVTLGYPCCSFRPVCREPLRSSKDRFCPKHSSEALKCCVDGCDLQAERGHITCSLGEHRVCEEDLQMRSQVSMSQLKARFARAGEKYKEDGALETENEESAAEKAGTSVKPARLVKARMSRRWTHNEQLAVYPCGIIAGRCTFYNSEALNGVKDFLKAVYPPEYPGAQPCYFFYDHACGLLRHLRKEKDDYFKDSA